MRRWRLHHDNNSTTSPVLQSAAETAVDLLDDWFDPIEAGLRDRVREFIQTMIESELETALSRPRYARRPKADPENAEGASGVTGHRHGHRSRSLLGTFGRVEIAVPRWFRSKVIIDSSDRDRGEVRV